MVNRLKAQEDALDTGIGVSEVIAGLILTLVTSIIVIALALAIFNHIVLNKETITIIEIPPTKISIRSIDFINDTPGITIITELNGNKTKDL